MARSGQSIFISYARDDVAFARDLRERLLALGHAPWMDLFDIPAGVRWPDEIDRALRSADAIIGVMSPASMASENVKNEWDWAIANSRRLILLLTEPCEIPFHYVSRNYIDLTSDQAGGLAALASAIESQDPPAPTTEATPPEPDPPPQAEPEPGPLIVGRQRELGQLREALDKSLRGNGQLVLVGGEAGIGKTTLVRAMLREAEQRGCLVLAGGCYDLTTTPPYGPWAEITRGYPNNDDLPDLPRQFQQGTGMEGIASRGMLFDLVGSFLTDVARQRPLTLVLEDLHWSDAESLALLRHLARGISEHPLLIIATYRDDELTRRHQLFQLLPALARESRAIRIELRQLPSANLGELVSTRYSLEGPAIERLAIYLQDRTDGNPLFVEEMLRTLEAEGILHEQDGIWALDAFGDVPIPPLVVQLIESRLAELEPQTQRLLEVAAVIGQDVPLDLWAAVSNADEQALSSAVSQALTAHLIEERPATFALSFRHALIREALYSRLVLLDRRRWHRAVADELLQSPQPDPDVLVTHLGRANDPRLAEWLIRAGARAMGQLAWDVAIERYQQALDLLEIQGIADPQQYCDVLLDLGEAQERSGVGARQGIGAGNDPIAQSTYWRAVGIARQNGLSEVFGRAAMGVVGRNFGGTHGGDEGFQLLRDALEELPDQDSPLRVRLMTRWAIGSWGRGHLYSVPFESLLRDILDQLDEAVAMARRLGDPDSLAYALAGAALIHLHLGELIQVTDSTQEIVDLLEYLDDREELHAWALLWHHYAQVIVGEIDAARTTMDVFAQVVARLQTTTFDWHLAIWHAGEAFSAGDFDASSAWIERVHAIWPLSGAGSTLHFRLSRELDDMIAFDSLIEAFGSVGQNFDASYSPWNVRHQYALDQGDRETARQFADGTWERHSVRISHSSVIGGLYLRMLANLTETTIWLKDHDRAREIYDLLLPHANLNIHAPYTNYFGDAVAHHLGLLASFVGNWSSSEEHFQTAIELESRWDTRPALAWSYYAYADMLHSRRETGDRYHALELLDQSLELARDIGMVRLERMATVLRQHLKAP